MASLSPAKGYSAHYANRQKKKQGRSLDYAFLYNRLPKGHTASTKNKFRSISVDHFYSVLLFFKDLNKQNCTQHLQNKTANRNFLWGLIVPPLLPVKLRGMTSLFSTYKLLHSLSMVIRD